MLSDAELAKMSNDVAERFDKINTAYIKKMGEHIREIGELSPTDLHRLEQMQRLHMNTMEINSMLIRETGLALSDLQKIYEKSGMGVYGDTLKYYTAKGVKQVPFADNNVIQSYMASQAKLTRNTFANLARTTNISKNYKKVMDQAIQAVSSGVSDYKSAMRSAMRKAAKSGMRVTYKSGVTRRLDSAVRMNVLEGIRQVNMGIRDIAGKEFGADGVELSAHALCATDHLPYQGLQYTNAEFEDLNGDLVRQIGTCNCHHYTFPILIGVSSRTYSDEELQCFKEYSSKTIDVDGKQMSRYEASQYMRKLETNMRYAKDEITIAKACGDKVMERRAKDRLRIMQKEYRKVGGNAGLQLRYDRAGTVFTNTKELKFFKKENNNIKDDFDKINSHIMLEKHFKKVYNIDIDKSVTELDFHEIKRALRGVEKALEEYPDLAKSIKTIKTSNNGVMSCNGEEIHFNPRYYSQSGKIADLCKEGNRTGFWVKNASPESIAYHECGHGMERVLIDSNREYGFDFERTMAWNKGVEAKRIVSQACKNIKKTPYGRGKINAELKRNISRYAIENPSETMAEAFADIYANGDNANPLSKEIRKLTIERLKQYKGGR